jgi:hypothetical protein
MIPITKLYYFAIILIWIQFMHLLKIIIVLIKWLLFDSDILIIFDQTGKFLEDVYKSSPIKIIYN